jgi:hypothetical protein
MNKTKILVIGAPRSGTTLLAGLLSAGKDASPMLPECTFITQVIQHYYNLLHYSDSQRFSAYAINDNVLAGMYKEMVNSMLTTVQSHFNDDDYDYLVLKDPELTQVVDCIPVFFGEDSKTVCVVRDPRAVIASILVVERKKKRDIWSAWKKAPSWSTANDLINQIFRERRVIDDFFVYYWRVLESNLYRRGAIHIVRYEGIVARDEDEFKKLEDYLGFSIGREGFGKIHFDFDRSSPTYSPGYGQAIHQASESYKKVLTCRQIKRIQEVFSGINLTYSWW